MLTYLNLDAHTRRHMLNELADDNLRNCLYISCRLSAAGIQDYPQLLEDAIQHHDDAWLERELRSNDRILSYEQRRKPKGGYSLVKVPYTAAQTLSEGEFNRFYIRGVCGVAIALGHNAVKVYRAKPVDIPRPESEALIGQTFDPKVLLADLRTNQGRDTIFKVPDGPNSGLSVCLIQ